MIGILNYGAGNVKSVSNALQRLGLEFTVDDSPLIFKKSSGIIIPGVGSAKQAMAQLEEKDLIKDLLSYQGKIMGICLGMQIMGEWLEEGNVQGLGIFKTRVQRLKKGPRQIHTGWNEVRQGLSPAETFIPFGNCQYFVHGYAMEVNPYTVGIATYGEDFSAAIQYENYLGVQFHPEKSGDLGASILKNYFQ